VVVAGWADMGLHPETFWLGYATITAAGWHVPASEQSSEEMSTFFALWYGRSARSMGRIYQLMSFGAQTWYDTWDTVDTAARKPIWGNSERIFQPPQPAHDQTVPLPSVPGPGLKYDGAWSRENADRLNSIDENEPEIDEVMQLLNENLVLGTEHRYNLEVLLSIAQLYRQNCQFFAHLRSADQDLTKASTLAAKGKAKEAITAIDGALRQIALIKQERNEALGNATEIWSRSWLPRVDRANGRSFVHEVDDVKDHLPDRTTDMSYLVYRELLLPMNRWYQATVQSRNAYAASHNLPAWNESLSWADARP
jgi:hexosaminidase